MAYFTRAPPGDPAAIYAETLLADSVAVARERAARLPVGGCLALYDQRRPRTVVQIFERTPAGVIHYEADLRPLPSPSDPR